MKHKNILVTGGAGFIGSHLTDALVKEGYNVRIFDNLEDQVHQGKIPAYLNKHAEFIRGDVRDIDSFYKAMDGMDAVFHEAAAVGVGQSQYEIKHYVDTNVGGTANLLDLLVNKKQSIKKIIVTTSMTSYGEGNYKCDQCGVVRPGIRTETQMKKHDWELHCPNCNSYVVPIPTDENAQRHSTNIYALTKNMQEDMILGIGKTYNLPSVALRCFNVYGPRQSLSNPYTGVTAIFISQLKNNKPPLVYEDGLQTRDFISVYDVVAANIRALEFHEANYHAINIGSGKALSIYQVAKTLSNLLGISIEPRVTGEYRKNDLRHCFADTKRAQKLLNWEPKISFEAGMKDLISWAKDEKAENKTESAIQELRKKGLST